MVVVSKAAFHRGRGAEKTVLNTYLSDGHFRIQRIFQCDQMVSFHVNIASKIHDIVLKPSETTGDFFKHVAFADASEFQPCFLR